VISGAREARPGRLRRFVTAAMARELTALVVPGPDVARACGVDLEAAGLAVVDTPRHASVLVLVGELPVGLKKAAAVAYAQMPRPRAVLAVGTGDVSPLPDVSVGLDREALISGVGELRRLFAENAFSLEAADFDADEIQTKTEYTCSMHPEVVSDEPGACPKCGMDLVPRESAGEVDHGQASQGHSGHEDHSAHGGAGHAADGHGEGGTPRGGHDHVEHASADGHNMSHAEHSDHEGHDDHAGMEHGEHGGHEHMDPGEMGFMSMVEMTEDLPRSPDGLPMEWIEVPFGPLLPGLPSGLSLTLTLDGDTVANTEAEPGIEGWTSSEDLTGSAGSFADRLTRLDPLSPVSYRVLALRALEDASGVAPDEQATLARVGALERERAASHLNWLAGFGHLIGYGWLERRAARLQLAVFRPMDPGGIARLRSEVGQLSRRVGRTPLLQRKLRGIGRLPDGAETSGPVARAGGVPADVRAGEEAYRGLGFEPVVLDGDDALARLRVRLAEVERSLELVAEARAISIPEPSPNADVSGTGDAAAETPRGTATLRVMLERGVVKDVELDTPSAQHLRLVESVAEQHELADALVGVASLDLSPWEITR
jgi:Ni,Fe-hydrogenase III large subunit